MFYPRATFDRHDCWVTICFLRENSHIQVKIVENLMKTTTRKGDEYYRISTGPY